MAGKVFALSAADPFNSQPWFPKQGFPSTESRVNPQTLLGVAPKLK